MTRSGARRRGFTLIELTLTMVVGSLVLLGVLGIFGATRTMERVFSARFERSTELAITQRTIRRAMLSLHVQSDAEAPRADANNEGVTIIAGGERPRAILEPSPLYSAARGAWTPQRFELVLGAPPIALDTMSSAAMWARADDGDEDTLDFSGIRGAAGTMRSVFELRPEGTREAIMESLGILPPGSTLDAVGDRRAAEPAAPDGSGVSWTLWWRPIPNRESEALRAGGAVLADDQGTEDEIRERLSGAVRLARDIESCRWQVFFGDEKVDEYSALYQGDIAAYIEFEILLRNGQYATWMFEIAWSVGDDPLDESADGSEGSGDDAEGEGEGDDADPGADGEAPGDGAGGGPGARPPRGGGGGRQLESDEVIRSGNTS